MWAALALTTTISLAPAQAGDLEIKNVRLTHGLLGQVRKDNKVLPGEIVFVAYDVHGVTVKTDGRVLYSTGFELFKKGKATPELKKEMEDKEAINNLGGTVMPSITYVFFGLDTAPGEYTVKVTMKDRSAKGGKPVTLTKDIEVLKPQLGFVRTGLTSRTGEPAPAVAVPGQAVQVNYAVVGFTLEKKGGLPDITVEVFVEDENGKPTLPDVARNRIRPPVKEDEMIINFLPQPVQLNRPGKYKVVLKVTDNLTKKTARQDLDINVLDR